MRIATLIVGLLLGLLLTIQTFAANAFGNIGDDTATANAAAAGIVMMLLWLFACALVIPFPLVSTILFAISAAIGLSVPTGSFEDLRFHGFFAVVLMLMAALGWRSKRAEDKEREAERKRQSERDALLASMAHNSNRLAYQRVCRNCGASNDPNVKFCGECGASLQVASIQSASS